MTLVFEEDETYKIMAGDAYDRLSVIPSSSVDCIFTSPSPILTGSEAFKIESILGDKCRRVLNPAGSMFVHMEDRYNDNGSLTHYSDKFADKMVQEYKWIHRGKIIWYMRQRRDFTKQQALIDSNYNIMDKNRFRIDYSYVHHFTEARYGYYFDNESMRFTNSSIFEEEFHGHSVLSNKTGFSESLVALCLAVACKPNGTVLDPYAGLGTTGVVALQMGYRFIGIEIDPVQAMEMKERLKNVRG